MWPPGNMRISRPWSPKRLSLELISRGLSRRLTTDSATSLFHKLAQHAIVIESMPNSLIITTARAAKNDKVSEGDTH